MRPYGGLALGIALAACAASAAHAQAEQARWRYVSGTDTSAWFVDDASRSAAGTSRSFWTFTVFHPPRPDPAGAIEESKQRWTNDCAAGTNRLEFLISYRNRAVIASGPVVRPAAPVPPETLSEQIHSFVCRGAREGAAPGEPLTESQAIAWARAALARQARR